MNKGSQKKTSAGVSKNLGLFVWLQQVVQTSFEAPRPDHNLLQADFALVALVISYRSSRVVACSAR